MMLMVLSLGALAVVAAMSGSTPDRAARDRDHDLLPDRWERRYDLSTSKKSAKGDPDRDGLRNRRDARKGHQFPNPETTGVPDGWAPRQTRASDLTVTRRGSVVKDVRFTKGADIIVKADDVTIRRVDMQGGVITNQYGTAPAGCGHDLLVEDTTFGHVPGRFELSDYPVIGEGSYTARRIEVDGRGEGPRLSDCGRVRLEDSFISVHGADSGTAACDEVHSDGVQAVAGVGATARNNTLIMETHCGTSPWFVVHPGDNAGTYHIDRLLVAGGGVTFRQQLPASVRGLRIVDNSWVYEPLGEMNCSVISPWDAKIVRVDASYRIRRVVRKQRCR